ncbi:MAG TPA: hypothetical protein VFG64_04440 [Dongiaceae bacterium]|nr:hypothetical protein [Dongiaceae bacterium]
MADLFFDGKLSSQGFIRQERCDMGDLLANRFGRYYALSATGKGPFDQVEDWDLPGCGPGGTGKGRGGARIPTQSVAARHYRRRAGFRPRESSLTRSKIEA